jgi:hypothetical protein
MNRFVQQGIVAEIIRRQYLSALRAKFPNAQIEIKGESILIEGSPEDIKAVTDASQQLWEEIAADVANYDG